MLKTIETYTHDWNWRLRARAGVRETGVADGGNVTGQVLVIISR